MPIPRHLPSRRWQIVGWATVLGAVSFAFGEAFKPGRSYTTRIENPLDGWESQVVGSLPMSSLQP